MHNRRFEHVEDAVIHVLADMEKGGWRRYCDNYRLEAEVQIQRELLLYRRCEVRWVNDKGTKDYIRYLLDILLDRSK